MRVIGGKLRLVERIAIGGMGEVHRAQNLATGGEVAVKLLEPTVADDEARERFRHEARVSAVLTHPSVVRVFDLIEEPDGTLALVMELLSGETLEQRLTKGPISAELAVAMMLPILAALDHAHAVGIIHRDVKPGNIFLAVEPDGTVTPKLLDFGVAKTQPGAVKTMDGKVLGTARYMSPEQVRGETLDARSDVWSAAVVAYEAITGHPPFDAQDGPTAISMILESTIDPHERIPPRLWLVLQRALSKRSYARQESARAFADEMLAATGLAADQLPRLSSDRPPLPKLETRGALRPVVAPSLGQASPATRRFRGSVVIGAFALGVLATASFVVVHARSVADGRERAAGAGTSSVSPPVAGSAPTAEAASVVTPPTAPANAITPARAGSPARKPQQPQQPKAVATTPGF